MIPLMNPFRLPVTILAGILTLTLITPDLAAQVASFTAPDTVCTGQPVTITNTSTGGSTYYWSFCSGSALSNPLGTNIGNPGNLLNIPSYLTLVKDGNTCYSFSTNQGTKILVRYNHGTSFSNNPVSWTNLGGFGMLSDTVMGVKVCFDNGQWIGFLNNNNRLVRLNFGASLANTPTATLLGPYPMMYTAHCLDIINEAGTWIGFITCSWGNKLIRLNFGTSLLNAPVLTDLGIPGALNLPGSFRLVNEGGIWYALVVNGGDATISRLTFGTSLLNTPTGVNLGVVCPTVTTPGGIALIRDCEGTTGFQLNYSTTSPDLIWRLTFPSGITGPVTGSSLGNIGAMSRPNQFSELFRVGDTLFLYNSNRANFTLTRLRFLPCSNASVPSSTLFTPPSFSYNQPGTYNIQLIIDEGLPTQASVCKSIVVMAAPCSATASFTVPDTVCTGAPITATNTSSGGSSYYWNFCSGSAAANPTGTNIGNPGNGMNQPVYTTLVQDGTDCYSFLTNHGSPTHITRYYHGTSFRNNPVSTATILQTGIIHPFCEAIQIRKENGNWYGFVNNNTTILRINFGTSLTNNSPTTTDIGPFPNIAVAHGLVIVKEGTTWLGFFDSSDQNKLYRLNFGASLTNAPVLTDFGNLAGFSHPCQIASVKENGTCYLLVVNSDGNSLSRINFGTSYLNAPTGQNLGNCGAMQTPIGITVLNDCETTTGYYTEYLPSTTTTLGKLTFSGGVGGIVTAESLGNIGTLHYPVAFSEMFRQNDSLFAYVANQYSTSLTRFSFPPCGNASIPSSTLFSPPPFSYNAPGTYSVRLAVDEGQFTEASICHSIVVMPQPLVNLGIDQNICPGTTTTLDAGAGFTSYLWSTGATTRTITVGTAGSYWAKGTRYGCEDYDTVVISLYPVTPVNLGPDQTICSGQSATFDAGACNGCTYVWANLTTGQLNIGTGQTYSTGTPGVYTVMVSTANICVSRDTIQLFTNPVPDLIVNPTVQTICSGNSTAISLSSSSPFANFSWSASLTSGNISGFSGGIGNTINQPLTDNDFLPGSVSYAITASIGTCLSAPATCIVTINPSPSITNSGIVSEMCSGSFTGFAITSNVPGTQFTWTAIGNSPDLSGFGPGVGPSIVQQLFNSGYTNPAVTYTVIPNALGCNGPPGTFTMTVHPVPDVTFFPASTSICTGDATGIQLNSQAQPATFTWTASGSSAFISNYFGGAGALILQSPQNSGPDPGTVTYTVTPASNGCFGMPVPYTATINPSPVTIVSPHPASVCSGDPFLVSFSSATAGTAFSWSASASSPLVTGYAGGAGNSINQSPVNPGNTVESVTYLVTPHASGCSGMVTTITVFVKPTPDVAFSPASQSVCYGGHAMLSLSSSFPGANCSWIATGSSPAVTGFTNGAGNTIDQALYTTGTSTQTVTYLLSSTLNGCTSPAVPAQVLTYPVPGVTATPAGQSICSGQNTGISLQSQLTGTTFQWSATGSSFITGYSGNNGNSIIQLLNSSSNTQGSVVYVVTPSVSTCIGLPVSVTVNVYPVPSVSFSLCTDTLTTTTAKPIHLRGGFPRGGIYSGPGVDGITGMFDPTISGAGLHSIIYTYSNIYGCGGNHADLIRVLPSPAFTCGGNLTDYRDGHIYSTFLLPNGKCWMKENLDFGFRISELFPQTDNCTPEYYLNPNSPIAIPTSVYQWDELMRYEPVAGSQGLCPPGWHVPSSAEWDELLGFFQGSSQAAGPLKDLFLVNGFHAIPYGFYYLNRQWAFGGLPLAGEFYWTSSASGSTGAIARGLNNENHSVSMYHASRANAFSVRCMKD
ncbi:MAG: PKD-like domain-containing protein [bacterium]